MTAQIPDMNPLRLYYYNLVPDWITRFPNIGNVIRNQNNLPGVESVYVYSDFVINNLLSLQLKILVPGTENLTVYKFNEVTRVFDVNSTIIPVDITPLGWISESVNRYDFTPIAEGLYYLESSTAGIRSDKFYVHSDLDLKKRLVKVQFQNYENDYGMIFWDGLTSKYNGTMFFTGVLKFAQPKNKMSVLESDRGNTEKLRSTPIPGASLLLTDLHYTEVDKINLIFSCSTITVNGITFQNTEVQEPEQIEKSDLVKITIKLSQTNYNYVR